MFWLYLGFVCIGLAVIYGIVERVKQMIWRRRMYRDFMRKLDGEK